MVCLLVGVVVGLKLRFLIFVPSIKVFLRTYLSRDSPFLPDFVGILLSL